MKSHLICLSLLYQNQLDFIWVEGEGGGSSRYHSAARGGSQTHATNHDARGANREQRSSLSEGLKKRGKGRAYPASQTSQLGLRLHQRAEQKTPSRLKRKEGGKLRLVFPCSAEENLKRSQRSQSSSQPVVQPQQRGCRAPPTSSRCFGFGLVFGVRNDGHLPKPGG